MVHSCKSAIFEFVTKSDLVGLKKLFAKQPTIWESSSNFFGACETSFPIACAIFANEPVLRFLQEELKLDLAGTSGFYLGDKYYTLDMVAASIMYNSKRPDAARYLLQLAYTANNLYYTSREELDGDGDIAVKEITYLHLACQEKRDDLIQMLLEWGMSPYLCTYNQQTEEFTAAMNMYEKMPELVARFYKRNLFKMGIPRVYFDVQIQ